LEGNKKYKKRINNHQNNAVPEMPRADKNKNKKKKVGKKSDTGWDMDGATISERSTMWMITKKKKRNETRKRSHHKKKWGQ